MKVYLAYELIGPGSYQVIGVYRRKTHAILEAARLLVRNPFYKNKFSPEQLISIAKTERVGCFEVVGRKKDD